MKGLTFGRLSLNHNGGTKSYNLAWLSCAETGKSILMKRWGKTEAFGQVQVLEFNTAQGAFGAAEKMRREKERGGYAVVADKRSDNSHDALGPFFGMAVWNAFGAESIEFLDADIDTGGMKRSAPRATRDENDRFIPPTPRHVQPDPEVVRREQEEAIRAAQAANPLFGLF